MVVELDGPVANVLTLHGFQSGLCIFRGVEVYEAVAGVPAGERIRGHVNFQAAALSVPLTCCFMDCVTYIGILFSLNSFSMSFFWAA